MPEIILQRSKEYNNIFRTYLVYIDNKKAGTIANGETKTFKIEPGQHSLLCKIDWCSSPEVLIEAGNDAIKNYKVTGFKYGNWLSPVFLAFVVLLPLFLKAHPELRYLYYLYIPIGGLLLYYLTIGRKKYLALKEL